MSGRERLRPQTSFSTDKNFLWDGSSLLREAKKPKIETLLSVSQITAVQAGVLDEIVLQNGEAIKSKSL